jgi:alkanesulfonate monooxygenase SsuD/methylene tetrahydromethanopterin reductase-like flavin-dependent oxidoreductase (luciferase family)
MPGQISGRRSEKSRRAALTASGDAAAGAAGVDPDTLPVMLQVNGNVTAQPRDERGPLIGSPEQVAADIDQAAKLGVEHIYWNTDDDPLRQLPLPAQLRRG